MLGGLSKLQRLDLSYIKGISDISTLAGFTNLQELRLTDNLIKDITPLVVNSQSGGLGQGDYICLVNNYLDITPESQDMVDLGILTDTGAEVNYLPQYPIVETAEATNILDYSAVLNGELVSTGGQSCEWRKFQYKNKNSIAWIDAGLEKGPFEAGTFSFNLDNLTPDTSYEFKALVGISSGWLAGESQTFTTQTKLDTVIPTINSSEPANGDTGVAVDKTVTVTFSEAIAEGSSYTGITLKDSSNNDVPFTSSISDSTLTIDPATDLAYSTMYTVAIPANAVQDLAGNPNGEYNWTFTTESDHTLYLNIKPATQACGSNLTATAQTEAFANPVYEFWVKSPVDDTWSFRPYSTENTYTFTKNVPGTYTVLAFAMPSGGPYSSAIASAPASVTFIGCGVNDLVVTGPSGSLTVGSSAAFTATATANCSTPLYQFWVHDTIGWHTMQDYSTDNTFDMNNLQCGSYVMAAYSLTEDDMYAGRWDKAYVESFVIDVGSSVTLAAPAHVAQGGQVNLIANAYCLTGVEYQYWYQTPDGSWHSSGGYTTSNTYDFQANATGSYKVIVYAKDHYAPDTDQFSVWDIKTINCP